MATIQEAVDKVDAAVKQNRDRADTIETRLVTWLLIGNGAALLFCFSALLDRRICSWPTFQPLVVMFAFGVLMAFSASLFSWLTELVHARQLQKIASLVSEASTIELEYRLKAGKSDLTPEDTKERDDKFDSITARVALARVRDRLTSTYVAVTSAALGASAAAFTIALAFALLDGRYAGAVCLVSG